jgi:endogenous inhibitor of DNA gyrase (YacG/DUF329 family)
MDMTEPDEPMPCAFCGYPSEYMDDVHEVAFCSQPCDQAWHVERENERRAEQIMDEREMNE